MKWRKKQPPATTTTTTTMSSPFSRWFVYLSLCVFVLRTAFKLSFSNTFIHTHTHNKTTNWIELNWMEWNALATYLFSMQDHKWVHLHDIGFFYQECKNRNSMACVCVRRCWSHRKIVVSIEKNEYQVKQTLKSYGCQSVPLVTIYAGITMVYFIAHTHVDVW